MHPDGAEPIFGAFADDPENRDGQDGDRGQDQDSSRRPDNGQNCETFGNGHIPGARVETSQQARPLPPEPPAYGEWANSDLELALRLSRQEQEEAEKQRQREEEELQQVLALSMTEK